MIRTVSVIMILYVGTGMKAGILVYNLLFINQLEVWYLHKSGTIIAILLVIKR
jgi:hypothetical protein